MNDFPDTISSVVSAFTDILQLRSVLTNFIKKSRQNNGDASSSSSSSFESSDMAGSSSSVFSYEQSFSTITNEPVVIAVETMKSKRRKVDTSGTEQVVQTSETMQVTEPSQNNFII